MQNSCWVRFGLLILLSISLTACDQMMTQLDALINTGEQPDCPAGKQCSVDMTHSEDMNWFLKAVKKP